MSQVSNFPKVLTQIPRLGLVCITASQQVRFRALTRKRLLQFSEVEQLELLRQLYRDNLSRLHKAWDFCIVQKIQLYRLSSALFPFADTPEGKTVLNEFRQELAECGKRAIDAGIRVVVHPDQFVVLNSDRPEVIENSIKILQMHADILDHLGLPRSAWAVMEIHGGKSGQSQRLIDVIKDLPEAIYRRLALENDEYAYSAKEILEICQSAGVPMVFDAHHHLIHEKLDSYDHPSVGEMLTAAQTTWPDPAWQLVHISNGRESFNDRHHSDLITTMPVSYRNAPWIEIEAKQKEDAIEKLRQEWLILSGSKV
jgi:UV DNA damage endonuclease